MVEGSTCGRAGRFFLRMIFLTLRSAGAATSVEVVEVRAMVASSEGGSKVAIVGGGAVSTSILL